MHLFVTFLQTGIDLLAVKLENDEEGLKDVLKDLNMLPDKCEVPQPDLLPTQWMMKLGI